MITAALSTIEPARTLVDLRDNINAAHADYQSQSISALARARECGELLIEAKAAVAKGRWLAWIKANIKCTPRTCQYYVAVAKHWAELGDQYETVSHLTLKSAIKMLRPEKPSGRISPEEFNSPEYQRLRKFCIEAIQRAPWQQQKELIDRDRREADEITMRVRKLQAKASRLRSCAAGRGRKLEAALQAEFEKQA